ncbi:IclR family transcriptional regulator [Halorarum salinum]|uniref:IclR family transcriptional regulator n=1 Tax=Halorarum salinum TaxID=2743089 RepID=A0A7D5LE04_9EURY|nr:IclR family transcriptional regulator [Halobaculum salinum]QLG64147.1 IclR family transcriptional regulator [Halobaculum salinum]
MKSREGGVGGVGATDTTFDVVERIGEDGEARVTELAGELGLAKSTVHNHLQTLRRRGYVVQDGDEYRLSLRFLHLGQRVRTRLPAYQLAHDKVTKLAEQTGERSQFIVEEHGRGVYMFREFGSDAVQTDSEIGKRIPLHATSAGKAILSALPESRVDSIVERHGLERYTDRTITDEAELREELALIRDRGYADNRGESTNSLWAVGAPVRAPDGSVLGALSVSAPGQRMKGERVRSELPDLLLAVANELELNVRYA